MPRDSTITVDNLRAMLLNHEEAQYVDLRDSADFAVEHVDGFTNIPMSSLADVKGRLKKNKLLILFCTNGKRAHLAADELQRSGFSKVRIVAGGLLAWKVQVFPVVTS